MHRFFSDVNTGFYRFVSDARIFAHLDFDGFLGRRQALFSTLDATEPALITDDTIGAQAFFQMHLAPLGLPIVFLPNAPDTASLVHCAEQVRSKKRNGILAVGGGTVLDACKWVAALLTNPGEPTDLSKTQRLIHAPAPLIAMPTTFGTGSETNMYSHLVVSGKKLGCKRNWLTPRCAILVGEIGVSMPQELRFFGVLDAWVHAFDALSLTRETSPVQHALANCALDLHLHYAESFVENPDMETGWHIASAAALAGIALNNARSGLIHSLAVPFAEKLGIAHAPSLIPFVRLGIQHNLPHMAGNSPSLHRSADLILRLIESFPQFHPRIPHLERGEIDNFVHGVERDQVLFKENPAPLDQKTLHRLFSEALT